MDPALVIIAIAIGVAEGIGVAGIGLVVALPESVVQSSAILI